MADRPNRLLPLSAGHYCKVCLDCQRISPPVPVLRPLSGPYGVGPSPAVQTNRGWRDFVFRTSECSLCSVAHVTVRLGFAGETCFLRFYFR